jgi:hypothetical protein
MQSLTQPSPAGEGFYLPSPAGEGLGMRALKGNQSESASVGCTRKTSVHQAAGRVFNGSKMAVYRIRSSPQKRPHGWEKRQLRNPFMVNGVTWLLA